MFLHGVDPDPGDPGVRARRSSVAIGVGGSVFDFISPLPYPFSVVGPVVGIWYVIGIVYLIYLYARKPERVRDTARVFVEEEVAEASAPV